MCRRPAAGLPCLGVLGLLVLGALSLLTGCAVSTAEYRKGLELPTVPSGGTIQAQVRLETSHQLGPEARQLWLSFGNPEGNLANYCQAMAQAVREDMVRSRLFAGVDEPGRVSYDAVIRVETSETKPGPWAFKTVLTVLDPRGQEVLAQYARETPLGDSAWELGERSKAALAADLAALRGDLLRDQDGGGKGLRTRMAGRAATGKARAGLERAREALAGGDCAAAWAGVRQALAEDPAGPAPWLAAADLAARLCDPEGSRSLRAEAARRGAGPAADFAGEADPRACRAQGLNKEGVALARAGRSAEAAAKFNQALQAAPGPLPKAAFNLGLLLEERGQAQEAFRQYLAAYQGFLLPAEQAEALARLAGLARRAGLKVPEAVDRRYRIGVVRAQQKRFAEAAAELEAALAEAPWLVDAYYNLGLVYDFLDRPADALRLLGLYLQLAPDSPQAGPVKTKLVELEDKLGLLAPAGR